MISPFLSDSFLGAMAGYVGRETGNRPSDLLNCNRPWLFKLMLDTITLHRTAPIPSEETTTRDVMLAQNRPVDEFVRKKFGGG